MGLDCFWMLEQEKEVVFDKELKLVSGLFSSGKDKFRGKAYYTFMSTQFGVNIYDEQDEDDVKRIAEQLKSTSWEDLSDKVRDDSIHPKDKTNTETSNSCG